MAVARAGCCSCLCLLVNNKQHLHTHTRSHTHTQTHSHAHTQLRTRLCICMRCDCVVKLFQYITPGPQSPWHHTANHQQQQQPRTGPALGLSPSPRPPVTGPLPVARLVSVKANWNELENKCIRVLGRLAPAANRLCKWSRADAADLVHRPHPPRKPKWLLLTQLYKPLSWIWPAMWGLLLINGIANEPSNWLVNKYVNAM